MRKAELSAHALEAELDERLEYLEEDVKDFEHAHKVHLVIIEALREHVALFETALTEKRAQVVSMQDKLYTARVELAAEEEKMGLLKFEHNGDSLEDVRAEKAAHLVHADMETKKARMAEITARLEELYAKKTKAHEAAEANCQHSGRVSDRSVLNPLAATNIEFSAAKKRILSVCKTVPELKKISQKGPNATGLQIVQGVAAYIEGACESLLTHAESLGSDMAGILDDALKTTCETVRGFQQMELTEKLEALQMLQQHLEQAKDVNDGIEKSKTVAARFPDAPAEEGDEGEGEGEEEDEGESEGEGEEVAEDDGAEEEEDEDEDEDEDEEADEDEHEDEDEDEDEDECEDVEPPKKKQMKPPIGKGKAKLPPPAPESDEDDDEPESDEADASPEYFKPPPPPEKKEAAKSMAAKLMAAKPTMAAKPKAAAKGKRPLAGDGGNEAAARKNKVQKKD